MNSKPSDQFSPFQDYCGGFSPNDGTIDFYSRVSTVTNADSVVLDLGAGRAQWFEDDSCALRRQTRFLKPHVRKVIAVDVDAAVLENQSSHENHVMENGKIPLSDSSVDVVIADYVLEHISDADAFAREVDRVLKPNGWFCARTPHSLNYVSLAARLVSNTRHAAWIKRIQPDRKEIDVFPTAYKMNTLRAVRQAFPGWQSKSFLFRLDPGYFFGRKSVFSILEFLHRLMPVVFCGNLFIYLRKPG